MIDVIDLKKTFGDLEVLKGINVTINKGDIVVVIGPSGSGKSTFLRCLNCMEDPTSGSIIFNGVDIADMRVDINIHRRHMGMVFQHFNLFNNMTVIENIMMAPVYVRCKELKKAKRKGTLAPDAPKTKAEIKAKARAEALELSPTRWALRERSQTACCSWTREGSSKKLRRRNSSRIRRMRERRNFYRRSCKY